MRHIRPMLVTLTASRRGLVLGAVALFVALVVPHLSPAQLPVLPNAPGTDVNAPPSPLRDSEPVILTGANFPGWSAPANQTAQPPLIDLTQCQSFDDKCKHNNYATPAADTSAASNASGLATPVDKLLGYRWDAAGKKFVQIPFQVDEVFTRYLDNSASGFAVYSGQDQHTTYAYDREGWRYTDSDPNNPATRSRSRSATRARRPRRTRCRASTTTTSSPSWPPTRARRRPPARSPRPASAACRRWRSTTRTTRGAVRLRLRDEGRRREERAEAGVQREQRLRLLQARRQRRHLREVGVELRRLRQRRHGPVLRRERQRGDEGRQARSSAAARATTRRSRRRATSSATTAAG